MLLALALALAFIEGGAPEDDDPDYPLGPLGLPPLAEPARPARLVDLRYTVVDGGSTDTRMEARARVGASLFVGAEASTERLGVFVDSQRLSIGLTESNAGEPTLEASYRAPWFLVDFHGERFGDAWTLQSNGSIRVSRDLELLVGYREDLDDGRNPPPSIEEFVETGVLPPPGAPTRELRSGSAGFLFQRGSTLDVLAQYHRAKLRSEAGFDFDRERFDASSVWNLSALELDIEIAHERTRGRLARDASAAGLGARVSIGDHLLASAETFHVWERDVLRFQEEYRAGLTWFGRRFRFARRSEIADRVLELQRRTHRLGYNERRVYDVEGLRAFRERLGVSRAQHELRDAVDALYRAQVRERNVPQLGFEVGLHEDALSGVDSRTYRGFAGVPWPVALPFARNESAVDFIQVELLYREDRYPAGIRALTRELDVVVFFTREMGVRFSWTSFGRTPGEIARERSRPSRLFLGLDYALGR